MRSLLVVLPILLLGVVLVRAALLKSYAKTSILTLVTADLLLIAMSFVIARSMIDVFNDLLELRPFKDFESNALSSAFIVPTLIAFIPSRLRGISAAFILAALSFLFIGDLVYFRFFGNIIPLFAFSSSGQIWDIRDVIINNLKMADAIILPVIAISIALIFSWKRPIPAIRRYWYWSLPVSLVTAGICLYYATPVYKDVRAWLRGSRSWTVLDGGDSIRKSGFIGAHIREIARTVREQLEEKPITKAEIARIKSFFDKRAEANPYGPDSGLLKHKNLLVVQVESLQQWVIGTKANNQEITPYLNGLQKRGYYFPNIFDQSLQSPTSDCEYLLHNSLYALDQGSIAFRFPGNDFVSLPKLFRAAGYYTFSAHAYKRGMWNRAVIHPAYGFQRSAFRDEIGQGGPVLGWGLGDKQFFERLVPKLKELPKPFFAFAITLTPHPPFKYIPTEERTIDVGALRNTKLGNYLYSMRYTDDAFRILINQMDAAGLLRDTAVVILGDHDNKIRLNLADTALAKRMLDLPEDIIDQIAKQHITVDKVPLLISFPSSVTQKPETITSIGGHIDIGPTLLYLFGISRPRVFLGQSLIPPRTGYAVRTDGSIVTTDRLFINAKNGICEQCPSRKRLPINKCNSLRKTAQKELEISWAVTKSDLARRIAE